MKLKQFQSHLQKEGIDLVFLIHPDSNIIYFTHMKPSFAFLLITPDTASLYLSKLDMPPNVNNLSVISLTKNWEKRTSDPKVKKIGVNKSSISLAYVEKLQKMYPLAELMDIYATI